jgi:diguanylate cyclase (GGDEF)-like protein
MSFRTRLISFFVVIVVVPMVAVGFLVFRLINDSGQGKADARANGLATAAASIYANQRAAGAAAARGIARSGLISQSSALRSSLSSVLEQAGLARIRVTSGHRVLADLGNRDAVAPGTVAVRTPRGGQPVRVSVSTLTARAFARHLTAPGVGIVLRRESRQLAATLPVRTSMPLPRVGTVVLGRDRYRVLTQHLPGFYGKTLNVAVLSNLSATSRGLAADRLLAGVFLVAFLVLAISFALLASRALHGQLARFLQAARRLAGGDFSSPVPIEGRDEFAELGREFNNMSSQLAQRLYELSQQRTRLRESITRIGDTLAANLDRQALLELALSTAVDGVDANVARLSTRADFDEPLEEVARVGSLKEWSDAIYTAERAALGDPGVGEAVGPQGDVIAVALRAPDSDVRAQGVITVCRRERAFTDDDRELLRSLAAGATLALENVELHLQVSRQAITDELTGLANHGHFQDRLNAEIELVRRYNQALSLILLDIDNFKKVNDTYGHQQGDLVLKHVARVLRESSRETDTTARYGGEELALILPHTDLQGAHAMAERVREAIESLRVPRLDQEGSLQVTASIGVACSAHGDRHLMIAEADRALYEAKRLGKNRTVLAEAATADVVGGG